MTASARVIVTGGSGLLGSELRPLLPHAEFPSSSEFDVTDHEQLVDYAGADGFGLMIHAAAFTSPPRIDADPVRAVDANIIGTANVVKLCHRFSARLFYLSTDYVFRGDRGNYREDDELHPVNKYAWSKLGGECAVRLYDRSLIIRTSFGPNVFPFEKAFVDQWTSRQSVKAIAAKIVRLIDGDLSGVVHVGGARRTVLDYARGLDPGKDIGELSVREVSFEVPADTSLDCSKWDDAVAETDGDD